MGQKLLEKLLMMVFLPFVINVEVVNAIANVKANNTIIDVEA
jgi:hypothetical protein